MISNNYIPEKINDANAYLDGTRMIGVAASVDLPEINMKTGTVEGFGIGGEVDSPTIGQWESFEQAVQFNTLYSSAVDMLSPMSVVNLTFRAAQQVYDKSGGYDFKGLRVVEMARVKKFKPGKIEKSEGMEAEVTVEVTYIMIEVDGEQLIEIDKLNGVYKVKGVDINYNLTGTKLDFADGALTLDLARYQQDDTVTRDIMVDSEGYLTTGRGLYYAAQVEIPARKYTETVTTAQETDAQAENGENTEGMSRETVTRTPEPLDTEDVTLYLFAIDGIMIH